MKCSAYSYALLGFLITALGTASFMSCTAPMSESEMDKKVGMNGGFEIVSNHLPVNWLINTHETAGAGNFEIYPDTTVFKEGKRSLKFSVKECSGKSGRFSPGIAQEIPVSANRKYLISFWVKNHGSTFLVQVKGVNAFNHSNGQFVKDSTSFSQWKKIELYYNPEEKMNRIRIEVSVLKPGNFWIDDIRIEKK